LSIFPAKPQDARNACRGVGPGGCDFPSLIGNDPYYGGLGGEFTISTESLTSGTIVLRHEMGHNFINVGEEYDGGGVYRGVNHGPISSGKNVPWQKWVTEPDNLQIESAEIKVQDYAWYDLARGPYRMTFSTNGQNTRWILRYSVSGCEVQDSIKIELDGVQIPWTTHESFDRFIEDYISDTPLPAGNHALVFTQLTKPLPGNPIRQLCSVTLHEYAPEPKFHMSNDFIGAYPTWRQGKVLAGYRPMNEKCLMRNMSSRHFCSVCYEGMWTRFFSIMSAIDEVEVNCTGGDLARVTLNSVKLGQLRPGGPQPGESLQVRWYWGNQLQSDYNDMFTFNVSTQFSGSWNVEMRYITPLVRHDPSNLLLFEQPFNISTC